MSKRRRIKLPKISVIFCFGGVLLLCTYFLHSAMKGENGIFRRIQIEDQAVELQRELDQLNQDIKAMQNLTTRLSNEHLDLDLLDERARAVLGYIRVDEIIIK